MAQGEKPMQFGCIIFIARGNVIQLDVPDPMTGDVIRVKGELLPSLPQGSVPNPNLPCGLASLNWTDGAVDCAACLRRVSITTFPKTP